jgi:hypothetical protein
MTLDRKLEVHGKVVAQARNLSHASVPDDVAVPTILKICRWLGVFSDLGGGSVGDGSSGDDRAINR